MNNLDHIDDVRKKEIADQIFRWARNGRSSDKFYFSDAKEKYQIIHENVLQAAFELLIKEEKLIKSGKSRNPSYSVSESYLLNELSDNDDDEKDKEEENVGDDENAVNGIATFNHKNDKNNNKSKKETKKKKKSTSSSSSSSSPSSSPSGKIAKIDNNNNNNNNEAPREAFFTLPVQKEDPITPIFTDEALSEDQVGKIGQYCFGIIADGGGQAALETLRESVLQMESVTCSNEQFDAVMKYLDKKGDVMVHDSLVFDCH